jgi:hypothetical protein
VPDQRARLGDPGANENTHPRFDPGENNFRGNDLFSPFLGHGDEAYPFRGDQSRNGSVESRVKWISKKEIEKSRA